MEFDEAKTLASYALGQLLQRDSSVEAGVRSVLRIATMRGHIWWQQWAYLHLISLHDDTGGIERAKRLLHDAFPDSEEQRDNLINSVFADVRHCRRIKPDENYSDNVGQLERIVGISDARISSGVDPYDKTTDDAREVLFRIKNRVQTYLMRIENGSAISTPSEYEDEP